MVYKDLEKKKRYVEKYLKEHKEEKKKYQKEYDKRPEVIKNRKQYEKEYRKTKQRQDYLKEWRKNNTGYFQGWIKDNQDKYNITHNKVNKRYAQNNQDKVKARNIAKKLKLKGDKCERCGRTGIKLEGHHFDYSQPDKIITLCQKCHREVHYRKN